MISTVEDYVKFLEALRIGDIILQSETIELMYTNQLSGEQLKFYWLIGSGYGLGVRCAKVPGEDTYFGWGGAAGAYPLIDRKHNVTFFYAKHVLNTDNDYQNIPMKDFFVNELCRG